MLILVKKRVAVVISPNSGGTQGQARGALPFGLLKQVRYSSDMALKIQNQRKEEKNG